MGARGGGRGGAKEGGASDGRDGDEGVGAVEVRAPGGGCHVI